MKTYQHTQPGTVIRVSMGIIAVVATAIGLIYGAGALWILAYLLFMTWLFHCLTIEVGDGELSWRFGPGVFRKRVRLEEIASATVVRTWWVEGWGIKYSRFGWLYNVSGLGGVAIRLKSGKRFCLGSDEPEALAAALRPPSSSPAR